MSSRSRRSYGAGNLWGSPMLRITTSRTIALQGRLRERCPTRHPRSTPTNGKKWATTLFKQVWLHRLHLDLRYLVEHIAKRKKLRRSSLVGIIINQCVVAAPAEAGLSSNYSYDTVPGATLQLANALRWSDYAVLIS